MAKAPHTLTRDHKQLGNRAAGTVINLTCPDCDGRLVGQLVYTGQNIINGLKRGNVVKAKAHNLAGGTYSYADTYDPWSAIELLQASHLDDLEHLEPSSQLDAETLPAEALVEHAIGNTIARLLPWIDSNIRQALPTGSVTRDLATIEALVQVSEQAEHLARARARQLVRTGFASQAQAARALGVTRQRMHQMLNAS